MKKQPRYCKADVKKFQKFQLDLTHALKSSSLAQHCTLERTHDMPRFVFPMHYFATVGMSHSDTHGTLLEQIYAEYLEHWPDASEYDRDNWQYGMIGQWLWEQGNLPLALGVIIAQYAQS